MKKLLISFTLVIFANFSYAAEKIAVVVGNEIISSSDIEARLKLAAFSSGIKDYKQIEQNLRPQIIKLIIDEKLFITDAKRNDIQVSDAEIDAAVADLEKQNNLPAGGLTKLLASNGISIKTLQEQLEAQLLWSKIVQTKLRSKVSVSTREVTEAVENLGSQTGLSEVNISEIILPFDQIKEQKETLSLADKLLKRLRDGGNFASIAKEFSRSNSAEKNGNLGWVNISTLDKNIASKVKILEVGAISDPIITKDSVHIIKLNERRALFSANSAETEVGLRQAFVPWGNVNSAEAAQKKVDMIQSKLNDLGSCDQFPKFAKQISTNSDPAMQMFQIKNLSPEIQKVLDNLKVGQASKPIKTDQGVRIIMLCERTKATTSLADTDQIRQSLFMRKLELKARQYRKALRKSTFIEVRS